MFKRRDWLHLKGGDGRGGGPGESSSDDDSDEEPVAAPEEEQEEEEETSSSSGSEGEGSDDEAAPGPGSRRGSGAAKDSEEEEDDEEAGPELSAQDVIKVWTSEDAEVNNFKGIPLRCVPCKALLLNRITYLQHVNSKAHRNKVKAAGGAGAEEAMIQVSSHVTAVPKEEEETHMERLERLQRLAAEATAGAAPKSLVKPKALVEPKAKKAPLVKPKALLEPKPLVEPKALVKKAVAQVDSSDEDEAGTSGASSEEEGDGPAEEVDIEAEGFRPAVIVGRRNGYDRKKRPGKRQRVEQRSRAVGIAEAKATKASKPQGSRQRGGPGAVAKEPLKRAGKRQRAAKKSDE